MKAKILSYNEKWWMYHDDEKWWMYHDDDRPIIGETMDVLSSFCPLYDYKCYDEVSRKIYWFKKENLEIDLKFEKEEFYI